MKRFFGVVALSALVSSCGSTQNNVVHYEAEGNLAHSEKIKCKKVTELSNENNPVDIFIGLSQCIEEGKYQNAAELYFAGMSFGYFDTKRVSDRTAHQAITVLRMNLFGSLPQEKIEQFQEAVKAIGTDDICNSLSALGKPEYFPTYMIQHGMGAFTGQTTQDGLVENFDSVGEWTKTMSTVAKCNVES